MKSDPTWQVDTNIQVKRFYSCHGQWRVRYWNLIFKLMHEWVLNLLLDDRVIASSGTMTRQSSQFSKSFDLFLLKSLFLVQKQSCFDYALVSHSYTCNIMY